jgi:hypothetical protein
MQDFYSTITSFTQGLKPEERRLLSYLEFKQSRIFGYCTLELKDCVFEDSAFAGKNLDELLEIVANRINEAIGDYGIDDFKIRGFSKADSYYQTPVRTGKEGERIKFFLEAVASCAEIYIDRMQAIMEIDKESFAGSGEELGKYYTWLSGQNISLEIFGDDAARITISKQNWYNSAEGDRLEKYLGILESKLCALVLTCVREGGCVYDLKVEEGDITIENLNAESAASLYKLLQAAQFRATAYYGHIDSKKELER